MKLVIGSKNTSSWSLRPWLLMQQAEIAFEEVVIPLRRADTRERILAHSPAGKVPALVDGDLVVWDSLAICEYLAELKPRLWPADRALRARARSISAEMHSGFADLRAELPMDFRSRFPRHAFLRPRVAADIERIKAIWSECRERHGGDGPFLFGAFSIADAMFAPVASRFVTYDVGLDTTLAGYVRTLMELPAMRAWGEAAEAEGEAAPAAAPEEATVPAAAPASTAPAPAKPAPEAGSGKEPSGDTAATAARAGPAVETVSPTGPKVAAASVAEPKAAPPAPSVAPGPAAPTGAAPANAGAPDIRPPGKEPTVKPIGAGILRRRSGTPPA